MFNFSLLFFSGEMFSLFFVDRLLSTAFDFSSSIYYIDSMELKGREERKKNVSYLYAMWVMHLCACNDFLFYIK